MSGALEMRSCTMRWKAKPFCRERFVTSPKFHFGNSEYWLKCYQINDEISLTFNYDTKLIDPSVPTSVTVHLEDQNTGQIVPVLTRTVQKPIRNVDIWCVNILTLMRNYPNFVIQLIFIVKFEASEQLVTHEKSVQTYLCINPIPCSEDLSDDWAKLLESDSNTDVDFQCDGQSIKAHRLVVSARSPVFARMLQSQMVEGMTGVVKIQDMDLANLRLLVHYLYTGRLHEALTFKTAMDLYSAADKYQVQSLARRCMKSLIEGLTVENALDALIVADRHSDDKLLDEVIVFMLEKKMTSANSQQWQDFCKSHPSLAIVVLNRYIEELNDSSSGPPRKKHCTNVSAEQPV